MNNRIWGCFGCFEDYNTTVLFIRKNQQQTIRMYFGTNIHHKSIDIKPEKQKNEFNVYVIPFFSILS